MKYQEHINEKHNDQVHSFQYLRVATMFQFHDSNLDLWTLISQNNDPTKTKLQLFQKQQH